MTEKAISKVKEFAEDEGVKPQIRAKVLGKGCAGLSFDLDFVDVYSEETDEVFDCNGVKLIVDQCSIHYLTETEIDYHETIVDSGFMFHSRNKQMHSCGCGKSVGY